MFSDPVGPNGPGRGECRGYDAATQNLKEYEERWFEYQYTRLIECTEDPNRRKEVIFRPYNNTKVIGAYVTWLLKNLHLMQTKLTGEDVYSEKIDYANPKVKSVIKSYFDVFTNRERMNNFQTTINFITTVTNVNGDKKQLNFDFFTLCFYNALIGYWADLSRIPPAEQGSGSPTKQGRSRKRDISPTARSSPSPSRKKPRRAGGSRSSKRDTKHRRK